MDTERADRMMASLPAYYRGNAIIERWVQAVANELDRKLAHVQKVQEGLVPGAAVDDDLGLLSVWEETLGLPVAPALTIEQRNGKLSSALISSFAATGLEQYAALRAAIGHDGWDYQEDYPGPQQVTITIPSSAGSAEAGRIKRLAERYLDAHLEVIMAYDVGFVLDDSLLDEAAL